MHFSISRFHYDPNNKYANPVVNGMKEPTSFYMLAMQNGTQFSQASDEVAKNAMAMFYAGNHQLPGPLESMSHFVAPFQHSEELLRQQELGRLMASKLAEPSATSYSKGELRFKRQPPSAAACLRQERDRLHKKMKRENESEEEAARRRERDTLRKKLKRFSESPEEAEQRRAMDRLKKRLRRESETLEEAARRRERDRLRKRVLLDSETPEEAERRRQRDRERKRKRLREETAEQASRRRELDRERKRIRMCGNSRTSLCSESDPFHLTLGFATRPMENLGLMPGSTENLGFENRALQFLASRPNNSDCNNIPPPSQQSDIKFDSGAVLNPTPQRANASELKNDSIQCSQQMCGIQTDQHYRVCSQNNVQTQTIPEAEPPVRICAETQTAPEVTYSQQEVLHSQMCNGIKTEIKSDCEEKPLESFSAGAE